MWCHSHPDEDGFQCVSGTSQGVFPRHCHFMFAHPSIYYPHHFSVRVVGKPEPIPSDSRRETGLTLDTSQIQRRAWFARKESKYTSTCGFLLLCDSILLNAVCSLNLNRKRFARLIPLAICVRVGCLS